MSSESRYPGIDLDLFIEARNWKAYLGDVLGGHICGRVLEVGAGIGGVTQALCPPSAGKGVHAWVCAEPDTVLAGRIEARISQGELPNFCSVRNGFLSDVPEEEKFDAILYIDVLEHIAEDGLELEQAANRLTPSGVVVVLAPAHQWLFSPLDAAAGHKRRYCRKSLEALTPRSTHLVGGGYLDSAGILASLVNRLMLRRKLPSPGQIQIWDRWMVPVSRKLDPALGFRLGKSVFAVWRRLEGPAL